MADYQVFARKYRPKRFKEVISQDAIVQTLIQSIKHQRLGSAYLFSGPHGTGKTTLARLFAKAINCKFLSDDYEPCNQCSSCKEISGSYSLDVLEIDGASHRGIEDIRQLNETIGYAPSSGKYKIYLIDEVHMLTKEAFNALLKSLEEPPPHVKFFFATTEPHQIPQTIVSRCQRFNLKRIPASKIVEKLEMIGKELNIEAEPEALTFLAQLAEGGMRDAESLFDELAAYQNNKVTEQGVRELLAFPDVAHFKRLDEASLTSDYQAAFSIVDEIFSSGKNSTFFLEELIKHFRNHFQKTLTGSSIYSKEVLFEILEILSHAQQEMKNTPSKKVFLEILLLRILNAAKKITLEDLISRLEELEKKISSKATDHLPSGEEKRLVKEESTPQGTPPNLQENSRHDTLMRFAAKELRGSLKNPKTQG